MDASKLADGLAPALRGSWERQEGDRLELLRHLVDQNSFADNLAGVDAERALLRPPLEAVGFTVEDVPPEPSPRPRAAHLVARRARPGRPRVLLIAHLDTVFPPDDEFRAFRRDGDLLHGPGVGDIKGGAVAVLSAVAALEAAGQGDACDLTFVCNSDEQLGSHASRGLLRRLALECDLALGFEPAFHPPGESVAAHSRIQHVVQRKGCGRYSFTLQGVAAHSGGAHHLGVSAIEGLARKVVDVHALTDPARGVTTNVGLVSGGRSVNTVAPMAHGEIDFRFGTASDGEDTARRLREVLERPEIVNPLLERSVTVSIEEGGGVLWPPLVPDDRSRALSRLVQEVSRGLGLEAEGIARGGASDAAHVAAVGRPAICGLGPVSHGIHTDAEHTSVRALGHSVLVAAALLAAIGTRI